MNNPAIGGSWVHFGLFLKEYLQTKLDNACVARTHHLAEVSRIQEECAYLVEVGVIQHIRRLRAKLHIHSFADRSVLEQRCIPAPGTRPEYGTPAGVAGSNAVRGWVGK